MFISNKMKNKLQFYNIFFFIPFLFSLPFFLFIFLVRKSAMLESFQHIWYRLSKAIDSLILILNVECSMHPWYVSSFTSILYLFFFVLVQELQTKTKNNKHTEIIAKISSFSWIYRFYHVNTISWPAPQHHFKHAIRINTT